MPIKNYTTKISAAESVDQIQALLRKKGARRVLVDYDASGTPQAIAFEVEFAPVAGPVFRLPFRLRARPEGVERLLGKVTDRRYRGRAQAERVAWRLVYNWIDVQLAFVEAGQAEMAELLLGFALSTRRGEADQPQTFYEVLLGADGPRLLAEHL